MNSVMSKSKPLFKINIRIEYSGFNYFFKYFKIINKINRIVKLALFYKWIKPYDDDILTMRQEALQYHIRLPTLISGPNIGAGSALGPGRGSESELMCDYSWLVGAALPTKPSCSRASDPAFHAQ